MEIFRSQISHQTRIKRYSPLVTAWRAGAAAERFYISIPGLTLSYVPLYYGQEKGFFAQEGLDLQVLVVRGIVG
jgi:ABC-type nitrate/sulfonate/bicarbonate transport system substrate-binding protein